MNTTHEHTWKHVPAQQTPHGTYGPYRVCTDADCRVGHLVEAVPETTNA